MRTAEKGPLRSTQVPKSSEHKPKQATETRKALALAPGAPHTLSCAALKMDQLYMEPIATCTARMGRTMSQRLKRPVHGVKRMYFSRSSTSTDRPSAWSVNQVERRAESCIVGAASRASRKRCGELGLSAKLKSWAPAAAGWPGRPGGGPAAAG